MPSVVVGLSGGVDSAVAALLLQREGHEVAGLFMKNWDEDDGSPYCTAAEDYDDACRIADTLNIDLDSISFAAEYWERVFAEFLRDYSSGSTPNPDILCNREIKFGLFLDYVDHLGTSTIATGHYARGAGTGRNFSLFRATDVSKDQTYFLSGVKKERLSRCLFPLGDYLKGDVRNIAKQADLHVHDKKDSTGICFIGERKFNEFLGKYVEKCPGEIVDTGGRIVGEHIGLAYYTFGQRKGLAIGGTKDGIESPWYVLEKQQQANRLVVTQDQQELLKCELVASDVNWLVEPTDVHENCQAMVRYRQAPSPCKLTVCREQVHVRFNVPQRAITPGQYVAFYDESRCLGSARIHLVN